MTEKRATIGRKEWIRAGYFTLGVKGLAGVNVESVAKTLNVSKGSFYWHFKDRQEWVGEILEMCLTRRKELVKELALVADPVERFQRLLDAVDDEAHETGFLGIRSALRLWALTDTAVAERLNETDNALKDIVRSVQIDLGYAENHADRTAQLAFTAFLGYAELKSRGTEWIPQWPDFKDQLKALVLTRSFTLPGSGSR